MNYSKLAKHSFGCKMGQVLQLYSMVSVISVTKKFIVENNITIARVVLSPNFSGIALTFYNITVIEARKNIRIIMCRIASLITGSVVVRIWQICQSICR